MRYLTVIALLTAGIMSGCSSIMNTSTKSEYLRVADHQQVADSSWTTGAVLGATLGVATSIGHGVESTAIRMAAGAVMGAGAEKALTRNKVRNDVRVVDSQGKLWVFDYDEAVVPGECLEISHFARGEPTIRKADTAWCDF